MGRYSSTKVKKNKSNKSHSIKRKGSMTYRTTLYDKIPILETDRHIIAQEGDRLDILATLFYGNAKFWWYIAKANGLNSMNVEKGTKLRIPASIENAKGK